MTAFLLSVNTTRLVFIDESGCKTGMRREHGWSPCGERVVGRRPGKRCPNISVIGAIALDRRPLLMTHDGGVGTDVFLQFVRMRLTPWLHRGDVVVMDNLRAHKGADVITAIEAVGATVMFLPPYSPDMNPIELWWADIKRDLRRLAIDCKEALIQVLGLLRRHLSNNKVAGWFRHVINQLN